MRFTVPIIGPRPSSKPDGSPNVVRMLGIDPGLDGSMALISGEGLHISRIPTYRDPKNNKRLIDTSAMFDTVDKWKPTHMCIEDVWSSDQMGVVSAFSFGEGKGILKGMAAHCGMVIHGSERHDQLLAAGRDPGTVRWVPPASWKAALKLSKDKSLSRKMAEALFPAAKKSLRSIDDCEAALLALYGLILLGKVH